MEELSERLGVSKSHLVRTFTAAIGVPPGRYQTTVRIEAAQRLLLHREYTLDQPLLQPNLVLAADVPEPVCFIAPSGHPLAGQAEVCLLYTSAGRAGLAAV